MDFIRLLALILGYSFLACWALLMLSGLGYLFYKCQKNHKYGRQASLAAQDLIRELRDAVQAEPELPDFIKREWVARINLIGNQDWFHWDEAFFDERANTQVVRPFWVILQLLTLWQDQLTRMIIVSAGIEAEIIDPDRLIGEVQKAAIRRNRLIRRNDLDNGVLGRYQEIIDKMDQCHNFQMKLGNI